MNSNGNDRDMEGEENPSHQTVEVGGNGNSRKRILEGSVSNAPIKQFKFMNNEDQFK